MNFLSLFVLIPLLMMVGLALSKEMKQIRLVAVTGSAIQLLLAIGEQMPLKIILWVINW